MPMRVSTNRGGWQVRGQSSAKVSNSLANARLGWILAGSPLTMIKS
jgi:hypothetical protein